MEKPRQIYGLFDPATGEIRYIGQTCNLKNRYSFHRSATSFDTSFKGRWLKSLRVKGLAPEIEVLETIPAYQANDAERFWIEYFKMLGAILTNKKSYQKFKTFLPEDCEPVAA